MKDDYIKIYEIIKKYVESSYKADIEGLKELFDEECTMTGYLNDKYISGTPELYFQDIASEQSMESSGVEYLFNIETIRIKKNIASVVFIEFGFRGNINFENHFELVKKYGQWRIVFKNFTTL